MNGDVQSDLSTLEFNNGEKMEYFHSIIIKLKQEIILSVETAYPTRLIFKYMKKFSDSDIPKAFIAPKMTYLIKLIDYNGNLSVYTGGDVHVLYNYLEMIGATNTLTTSCQCSNHFGP